MNKKQDIENLSPLKRALIAVEEMQQKLRKIQAEKHEPIAVVGMACRFPKANNLDEFWNMLINNLDGISEVPPSRWDIDEYYSAVPGTPGKMVSRYGGFIDDFDKFDSQFFGISPREAEKMDPQQRVLMQTTWEAFENAGINVADVSGSDTGVFIGISTNDYSLVQYHNANGDNSIIDAYQGSGNSSSIAANRISYFLNLNGPSVSVDTACSSSLVSIHMALQSLKNKESNFAIAGGVGLILSPYSSITFSQAQMLAPGGRCRTFDASAEGYVRGEGVGVVLLKRLADAQRDGDNILAVIRSSAINQDGKTNGLTAPNSFSQVNVIKQALKKAKLTPNDISFIETHGTGTILGDPIEIQALGMVMKERELSNPCYLGAVKTNIGHLEAAAGIAGFIKTVLVLQNRKIPANLHFQKINPHIPISDLPFKIPQKAVNLSHNNKVYAGVSSFGFGGTNAHIILESSELVKENKSSDIPANIFCLSAQDEESLKEYSLEYVDYLNKFPDTSTSNLCFTANSGRHVFAERIAVTFKDLHELKESLFNYAEDLESFAALSNNSTQFEKKKTAFLFTGQGSQFYKMARDLYENHKEFREIIEKCFNISDNYTSLPLRDIIFGESSEASLINETEFTQPSLFIIEYALAQLWISWGMKPDYLIGHSIGEYTAACIAGVFSLETGIKLTALRGKLMQSLPKNGSMAVIFSNIEKVQEILKDVDGKLSIAGINGPTNVVISGESDSISKAISIFKKEKIETRSLVVSHAFHSSLMEPIIEEFKQIASKETYQAAKIPIITNLKAEVSDNSLILDSNYWAEHILNPVKFYDCIKKLGEVNCNIFIEVGPHPVLIGMAKKCINLPDALWIPTLKRDQNNWVTISNSLAELFVSGIKINWKEYYNLFNVEKISLPTYPFKKERYYSDPKPSLKISDVEKIQNIDGVKGVINRDSKSGRSILSIVDKNNKVLFSINNVQINSNDLNVESPKLVSERNSNSDSDEKILSDSGMEDFLNNISIKPMDERLRIVKTDLQSEIGKVLRLSKNRVDTNKSITHLGLDSIMAIEVKNKIEQKYKTVIPISDLIKGPTINEIAEIINDGLQAPKVIDDLIPIKLADKNYALSYGQNAMWFQHQMAPSSIFNPTYAVKIKGDLDKDKLNDAVKNVIRRHASLRTTFKFCDGDPTQYINSQVTAELKIIDCKDKLNSEVEELVFEFANKKFEIESGELFRIILFERENESMLLISAHHIAVDYWSMAIIVNEIGILYQSGNNIDFLDHLKYSYIDFVNWQSKMLQGERGKELEKFWLNYLSKEIPNLDLPIKNTRPPIQTFNGSSKSLTIPVGKAKNLKKISEKYDATLYMVLLSIFKILLHKYSNQDSIIVGTPTTGRSQSVFKNIVGYFVNPLPIKTDFYINMEFSDLVKDVKDNLVDILNNQDYPLNLLVNKLNVQRDTSRTPVFQVMFVFQKAHVLIEDGLTDLAVGMENAEIELAGIPLEQIKIKETKSIFDLTMMVAETKNGITASLVYNTDLFDEKLISRFLEHFDKLTTIITEDNNIKISDIALVDNPNELISSDFSFGTEPVENELVQKLFETQVLNNPNKTALEFKNSTLSYGELNKTANRIATYLLDKKLSKETRIGIFIDRSFGMIQSIIAILKAGYVYVPIDTTYPQDRIRKIIEDAGIKIILSEEKHQDEFQAEGIDVVCIDCEEMKSENLSTEDPQINIYPENLAYSIYTSGSTGEPKGVMLTHFGLTNLVKNQTEIFNISSESNVLQLASLSFDASVSEIFTSLCNGATLHLVPQEVLLSGTALIDELNNYKVTVATIPPSLLSVIPHDDLSNLKTLVSAGELITIETAQKWANGRKFINAYGPTEATVCTTAFNISDIDKLSTIPIGTSIGGMDVLIFDNNFNLAPKGVPGELHIAGIGLARGYNNTPDITAEKFIPNPFAKHPGERLYRTGDLVKLNEDGNLEFLGRIDDQVKFRGYRIELKEIRAVLENHEKIKKSELLLKNNLEKDNRLVAFYISADNEEIKSNDLKEYVRDYLPDFMIPSVFVRLDTIPLTSNGKVNKKALNNIRFNGDISTVFENPQSEFEKEIALIWKEVLGLDKLSINDNFFDLGGHSLNVIQLQSKIKEKYERDFTVVDFFKYPTIKLFAKFLSNGDQISDFKQESRNRTLQQKQILMQRSKLSNRRNFK